MRLTCKALVVDILYRQARVYRKFCNNIITLYIQTYILYSLFVQKKRRTGRSKKKTVIKIQFLQEKVHINVNKVNYHIHVCINYIKTVQHAKPPYYMSQ